MQNLTLFVLHKCGFFKLRRLGTDLYKEKVTPEGYGTYSYERFMTIEQFVRQQSDKNTRFDHWVNQTDRGGSALVQTVKYLENCTDWNCPN